MQGTSHIAVTAEAVSQPDISRKGVIVDGNGEEDTKQGLHCASARARVAIEYPMVSTSSSHTGIASGDEGPLTRSRLRTDVMSRLCSLVIPYIVRELSSDRESEVCESMGTPAAPLSLLYIEARHSP